MIKKSLITLLLAFTCVIGLAQNIRLVDSLKYLLANAKDDTSRVNAMQNLGYYYRLGNTDSSFYYLQLALKYSRRINYAWGEMKCLSSLAVATEQLGNLPQALEMGFKALQIAKANHLEYYSGGALNAIGETYLILKDYPTAAKYFKLQKSAAEGTSKNYEGLAYATYDLGYAYEEMNMLDSATYYEELAVKYFLKTGRAEPMSYRVLGDIAMKSGHPDKALAYYKQSLAIAIANKERRAAPSAYNKLAAFYSARNQPDSAIYYAMQGLVKSQQVAQKKTILEAASLLSALYEPKDTKESLRYLRIADAYKDSLYSTGNLQAVQTLVAHEDQRQKEIKETQLAYRNQLKEYALLAGLGILLLIAFILFRNNQREKKDKKLLAEKNVVIENALSDLKSTQTQLIQSEKMASLGELTAGIAHEIQNPLNFVNNFSEINTELVGEMKQEIEKGDLEEIKSIATDIEENSKKINMHGKRADGIVKGMLQHSQSGSGTKEPTNINALADEYLRLSYHGLRSKDKEFNSELVTQFDPNLPKITVIPQDIGRVLFNLFNNAFYAVNQKQKTGVNDYKPEVSVSTLSENGRVIIKVKDNGIGIPDAIKEKIMQPFFTTKPTGEGTGLGLSLTYDMVVKGHGGTIQVNSKEGDGSEFIIQLPA